MTLRIVVTPEADRDVLDIADHISEDSIEAAFRFVESFKRSLLKLKDAPFRGAMIRLDAEPLRSTRWIPVDGFANHLIYYTTEPEAVVVIRVLHGAREQPRE